MIQYYLPLPVPASIYGLILLFLLLCCKVIRVEQVQDVAQSLIAWMPLMFIPSIAGLLTSWTLLAPMLAALVIISIVSTVLTIGATGCAAQAILRMEGKGKR